MDDEKVGAIIFLPITASRRKTPMNSTSHRHASDAWPGPVSGLRAATIARAAMICRAPSCDVIAVTKNVNAVRNRFFNGRNLVGILR